LIAAATHNVNMNLPGISLNINTRVTREDILWCYRNILKRPPEDEDAITPHLKHKTFRSLAESFAQSDEGKTTVTREDVLWCYQNILGRKPEPNEPLEPHLGHSNFRLLAHSFAERANGIRAVTSTEVRWAYRHILRREPESEEAVKVQLGIHSFRDLVEAMGNTDEVMRPLSPDDVLWCYRHILGREPAAEESLEPPPTYKDFRELAENFAARTGGLHAVTVEDVRWAFRHILGREAESDEAVAPHLEHRTFRDMVDTIANCREAIRFRKEGAEGIRRHLRIQHAIAASPPTIDANPINAVASPAQLAQCFTDTQKIYTALNLTESSGGDQDAYILPIFRRHGAPEKLTGNFVLLGCDTRLLSLAKHFETVHAYDFSPVQIEQCQAVAALNGTKNITFQGADTQLLNSLPTCQYFYSPRMLQYCPPPLGVALIRNALRALLPGGIAIAELMTELPDDPPEPNAGLDHVGTTAPHPIPASRLHEIASGQSCDLLPIKQSDGGHHSKGGVQIYVFKKRGKSS
jgi:hypothetical protein